MGETQQKAVRHHRVALEEASGSVAVGIDVAFAVPGGGEPRSGIPVPLPGGVENGTEEEDDDFWDMYEAGRHFDRCANCHRVGHGVAQCMIPRLDGYVHGCSMCNTRDHRTINCEFLPSPCAEYVDVLIRQRHNMPPLEGVPWYPIIYAFIYYHPGVDVQEFPWTVEFSQQTLIDPDLGIQAVDAMETGQDYLRPVDPRTRSWEVLQETFGEIPHTCAQNLKEVRFKDKMKEMRAWLRDEERIGEL